MLSSWDDYPVHQTADVVRHVVTSDRNFYDRYYFNLHASGPELFLVMGMGQYPNLGVQDAFAVARRGTRHHVVRASRALGDRRDTSVGPFRIEVLEPLRRLRFTLDETEHGIAFDLVWQGSIAAHQEPRHFIRRHGRVLFDTSRFAQTGCWSGSLRIGGERFEVTPDRWWGTRDRSWGVRPVGEPEHPGIRQGEMSLSGMWNYSPMQFADHSILYILQETNAGERELEEAVRIWSDPARPIEHRAPRVRAQPRPRHARDRALDALLPARAGRRHRGEGDAARVLLHRRRHRLRARSRLAPRELAGSPRRAGARARPRRRGQARPVR